MLPTKHCGKKTQSLNTKEISYAYIFEAKRHSEYIFFFLKEVIHVMGIEIKFVFHKLYIY